MNPSLPPSLGSIPSLFRHPLALLGGVLLCLAPGLAPAQRSVTFIGAQSALPFSGLNQPDQVCLDSAGDVFVTDQGNSRALELPLTATGYGPQVTLPFTGLSSPTGIAVDGAGDVFVADFNENDVVELPRTPTGYGPQVTLPFSSLDEPTGLALDSEGDVLVANQGDNLARELPKTATGYGPQVTLPFVGFGFNSFLAITVDSDNDVFLTDNGAVLELPWTGTGYGTQVTLPTDGLNTPWGVAVDSGGDVFITDWGHYLVVELPKTSTGYGPQVNVPFGILQPHGDAVDNHGNLFVADSLHDQLAELQTISVNFGGVNICPAGKTTPAPCSETLSLTFNVTASRILGTPKALTLGAPDLDFTLASESTCTGLMTEGSTCTVNVTFNPRFAGLRKGGVEVVESNGNVIADVPVYGIGIGPQVTFQPGTLSLVPGSNTFTGPRELAADATGNLFVADWDNSVAYEMLAAGGIKTLDFGFGLQTGVAVDGSGNVFAAGYNCYFDRSPTCGSSGGSGVVYEILAAGGYTTAKTLAVYPTVNWPWGVAVDGSGNVFVADAYDNAVKEILAAGGYTTVKTLAAIGAYELAVDGSGNLFAAEGFPANLVVEILAAGGYTTIKTLGSGFVYPVGVALDASGNVFVADYHGMFSDGGAVKEILATGGYTTVKTLVTGLSAPQGIAVDGSGKVFFGLTPSGGIDEIDYADPPSVVFPTATAVGTEDTADGPQTVSVWNSGNQALLFSTLIDQNNPYYAGDFHENTTDTNLCTSGLELDPSTSCDVSINFVPSANGINTGSVVLANDALNDERARQTIPVSGTGTAPPPGAQVSPNPLEFGAIAFGTTKTLPLTVTNTGGSTLTITPSNSPGFPIQSSTCAAGVAAGDSCVLQVQYSPPSFGVHGVFMTLMTNGPTNPVVKLSGETIGVGVTSTVLDFGTIPFGTTETLPLTVTSYGVSGTVPITLSVDGHSFTVPAAGNTCLNGVASGLSCTLQVQFSPTTVGQHEHTLSVQSSYGTVSVLLKGAASQP